MNCAQANQIDMVSYLYSLGFQAKKVRGDDHWYLSPLREEKTASFKINYRKNVWYDHGIGEGGTMVDFVTRYFDCNVATALEKLAAAPGSLGYTQTLESLNAPTTIGSDTQSAVEPGIHIVNNKQPINSLSLLRYLKDRRIAESIANQYCTEVTYRIDDKATLYTAVGFKNNAGGCELRSPYFKGSSASKYVTYFEQESAKSIAVFEGFFDFLSYQTIHQNQEQEAQNILVLNSLSFFERSLLLMEKHQQIHLYLDHDKAGRKCTEQALKRSLQYEDKSSLYQGYKDLNEWVVNFGKKVKQQHLRSKRIF